MHLRDTSQREAAFNLRHAHQNALLGFLDRLARAFAAMGLSLPEDISTIGWGTFRLQTIQEGKLVRGNECYSIADKLCVDPGYLFGDRDFDGSACNGVEPAAPHRFFTSGDAELGELFGAIFARCGPRIRETMSHAGVTDALVADIKCGTAPLSIPRYAAFILALDLYAKEHLKDLPGYDVFTKRVDVLLPDSLNLKNAKNVRPSPRVHTISALDAARICAAVSLDPPDTRAPSTRVTTPATVRQVSEKPIVQLPLVEQTKEVNIMTNASKPAEFDPLVFKANLLTAAKMTGKCDRESGLGPLIGRSSSYGHNLKTRKSEELTADEAGLFARVLGVPAALLLARHVLSAEELRQAAGVAHDGATSTLQDQPTPEEAPPVASIEQPPVIPPPSAKEASPPVPVATKPQVSADEGRLAFELLQRMSGDADFAARVTALQNTLRAFGPGEKKFVELICGL